MTVGNNEEVKESQHINHSIFLLSMNPSTTLKDLQLFQTYSSEIKSWNLFWLNKKMIFLFLFGYRKIVILLGFVRLEFQAQNFPSRYTLLFQHLFQMILQLLNLICFKRLNSSFFKESGKYSDMGAQFLTQPSQV